jgi:hypothetical protein
MLQYRGEVICDSPLKAKLLSGVSSAKGHLGPLLWHSGSLSSSPVPRPISLLLSSHSLFPSLALSVFPFCCHSLPSHTCSLFRCRLLKAFLLSFPLNAAESEVQMHKSRRPDKRAQGGQLQNNIRISAGRPDDTDKLFGALDAFLVSVPKRTSVRVREERMNRKGV